MIYSQTLKQLPLYFDLDVNGSSLHRRGNKVPEKMEVFFASKMFNQRLLFVGMSFWVSFLSLDLNAWAGTEQGVLRVALVAWHDLGWKGLHPDQKLRFPRSDAESIASVLREKGQFEVRVLARPTAQTLWENLYALVKKAKKQKKKLHFLFYYSGHADKEFLRLGPGSQVSGQRFALSLLAKFVQKLEAAVKIIVLDACHSGAFIDLLHTRTKGRGTGYLPFFQIPQTLSRGMAVLTSASASGTAREIDHLRASLFTYHLVKGLKGFADIDKDGQVTSLEAYHYARLMLEKTLPGRQKPMYMNHFRGQKSYPITAFYNASLVLPMESGKRYVVLGKHLVRKLHSKVLSSQVVPLMAGSYRVFLQNQKKHCFSQKVNVPKGKKLYLKERWRRVACPSNLDKGRKGRKLVAFEDVLTAPFIYRHVERRWIEDPRLSLSFGTGALNASLFRPSLGLQAGFSWKQLRFGLAVMWEGQGGDSNMSSLHAELQLGYGWTPTWRNWSLFLGGTAALGMINVDSPLKPEYSGLSESFRYGLQAELSFRAISRLILGCRFFLGAAHTLVRGTVVREAKVGETRAEKYAAIQEALKYVSPDVQTDLAFQVAFVMEWRL